jgi:chloramphenicol 3-O phosphotransferase
MFAVTPMQDSAQRADMEGPSAPGQIVILNGAPRSGKSSIVAFIQDTFEGIWMNLGVDVFAKGITPRQYLPGVGLRPGPGPARGGDRPDLEPLVPSLFDALYEAIAAWSRLGLNVVADVGHHGAIHPDLLAGCARRLAGLPVLFVGVRCPMEEIMKRRGESRVGAYVVGSSEDPVPWPVRLWQEEVHKPGLYDLELDTSMLGPDECAAAIRRRLDEGPPGAAFAELARQESGQNSR